MTEMPIRIVPVKTPRNDRDEKKSIEIAPGVHTHASVSVRKLEKRIVRLTAQAISDYDMIEDGDKILVAMSGGKDSYVLLETLMKLQKRAPVKFDLLAVHVDQHIPGSDAQIIENFLKAVGVPYHIESQDTHAIIERLIPTKKNICSLCARLRRGILYRVARETGCTKIALGHQMDDVVSTLLLNLFYGGRIKAMPPILRSDDKTNIVIRPLVYVREYETAKWAKIRNFPTSPKHLCGAAENKKRQEIKAVMADWDKRFDGRIYNLFMSTTRVAPSQLADKSLFDFKAFCRQPNRASSREVADAKPVPKKGLQLDAEHGIKPLLMRIVPWRTPF